MIPADVTSAAVPRFAKRLPLQLCCFFLVAAAVVIAAVTCAAVTAAATTSADVTGTKDPLIENDRMASAWTGQAPSKETCIVVETL